MAEFDTILNWQLLTGSHEFPGPDGGTCINEAAVVAAGFEYREVRGADDLPPCFSRVISVYALGINDRLGDHKRQVLLPFVARLAGTADNPAVELKRLNYLAGRAARVCPDRDIPAMVSLRAKFDTLTRMLAVGWSWEDHTSLALDVVGLAARIAAYLPDSPCTAVDMLEGVLAIGRRSEVEVSLAAARLGAARASQPAVPTRA